MRKIDIFDTTLRDGEQSPGVSLNLAEKIEIAKQLERLGVDIIEAGFPASSNGDFESVKTIAGMIKNSSVTGLSRVIKSDIDAAWEALKHSEEPRIHVFIATSPIHMKYKLMLTPDEVVEAAVEGVKYAAERFPIVQWSAEDACRSDRDFLVQIIKEVIDAGAKIINIPDTVGYISPNEYGELIKYLRDNVPNIDKVKLSAHCHDDLGMAVANSLAGIENGIEQVECTINGIGERAGNASLEEIAIALHIRQDHYQAKTNINFKEIKRTSNLVSKLTGMTVPPNKAVVGANAFAHQSGIHQDGMLKEKTTYEIITPELVGFETKIVLGKLSGRNAFNEKAKELGFELDKEELQKAFKAFKDLADKKKEITDDDIYAILTENRFNTTLEPYYEIEHLQVQFESNDSASATIALKTADGTTIKATEKGSGSVDAIYKTLEKLIGMKIVLKDYKLQSVGEGKDALAQVNVKLEVDGKEINGHATVQDVLESSAKAYLNAVNRVIVTSQIKNKQVASN